MFAGFEQISYTVPEAGGSVNVCVVILEAPGGGYEGTITVFITSVDGDIAGLSVSNE